MSLELLIVLIEKNIFRLGIIFVILFVSIVAAKEEGEEPSLGQGQGS
jgi:hypothetical protein